MFSCSCCSFSCKYDYYGKEPPMMKALENPFCDSRDVIILGEHCHFCTKPVCMNQACSVFGEGKRICMGCAKTKLQDLSVEMRNDVLKAMSSDTTI